MADFEHLANTIGVPMAILAWLAVATWVITRWLAAAVIVPVTARHLAFMDAMTTAIPKQTEAIAGINAKLASLDTIDERAERLEQQTKQRHDELVRLLTGLCKSKS